MQHGLGCVTWISQGSERVRERERRSSFAPLLSSFPPDRQVVIQAAPGMTFPIAILSSTRFSTRMQSSLPLSTADSPQHEMHACFNREDSSLALVRREAISLSLPFSFSRLVHHSFTSLSSSSTGLQRAYRQKKSKKDCTLFPSGPRINPRNVFRLSHMCMKGMREWI